MIHGKIEMKHKLHLLPPLYIRNMIKSKLPGERAQERQTGRCNRDVPSQDLHEGHML